jgi:serine phosphatase RsbU (regulator of sigma subunit)
MTSRIDDWRHGALLRHGRDWLDRLHKASPLVRLAILFTIVIAALVGAGMLSWRQVRAEVAGRAQAEADRAVDNLAQSLEQTDRVFGPLTRAEVRALRAEAARLGAPSLRAARDDGVPVLRFGTKAAGGDPAWVQAVADRMGGAATLLVAKGASFFPVSATPASAGGAPAMMGALDTNTEAYALLRAGRPFTGPFEGLGGAYFAHFEPIESPRGAVIGAYGALYPNEALDEASRALTQSGIFKHGFLMVVDRTGKPLFRYSALSPGWLVRQAARLTRAVSMPDTAVDGFRLSTSKADPSGLRVVAGVYEPDVTVQAVRLEGASLGLLALVIVLALCLAWLMARRLTEALDQAERHRLEAERAKAVAEAAGAALNAELEQAARYVASLLPPPTRQGAVATDWLYRPSTGVGGDAFGYHWLDETRFTFYLLDVCGHGVGAALLATTVMNVIRAGTLGGADFAQPSTVLTALNDAFPMEAQNGMYFTIWYGVYDTSSRVLSFAAAGHHPAVLVERSAAPQLLQGKGLPIGCFERVVYPMFSVNVPAGARLYVFSDGLFEVELNAQGEMFTFEEFVNVIMDWRDRHSTEELSFVVEAMQSIQGKPNFDDDCALIEFEFREASQIEEAA